MTAFLTLENSAHSSPPAHAARQLSHQQSTNDMSNELAGKVALVTGPSKGIGAGIATAFGRAGALSMLRPRPQ